MVGCLLCPHTALHCLVYVRWRRRFHRPEYHAIADGYVAWHFIDRTYS